MNINLPGVVLLGVGALFMYAAVKGGNPATVVKDALSKSKTVPKAGGDQVAPAPSNIQGMQGAQGIQRFENRSGL